MSIELMSQVWKREFPPNEQQVMLALADHADDAGNRVFPSVALTAWKTGYSTRTIQRVIKSLTEREILVLVNPATNRRPNEYRIDLTKAQPKPPFRGDKMSTLKKTRGDKMSSRGDKMSSRGDKMSSRGDTATSPDPSLTIILEPSEREKPPLFLPSAADRNGWNRKPKQFIDGIVSQVESFGITMAAFRVLVDHVLAKHGKLEIANTDTDHGNTALRQAQECVIGLLAVDKDGFGTADGIDTIYQSWRENDWRGGTLPTLGQLVDHAGLMAAGQVTKAQATAKTEADQMDAFFSMASGG